MPDQEKYTLGYGSTAVAFVGRRTLESHGAFFLPHLSSGVRVLDCGCGPGSITLGIAARVGGAEVVGVDMDEGQIATATRLAAESGLANAAFRRASAYELPFPDASFDAVFSHALFEHLADPLRAATECLRVLKPGGVAGVATPDWGGFLVEPMTADLAAAIAAYEGHLAAHGGNARMGRRLAATMAAAGFERARMHARYENYDPLTIIGETMARQAEDAQAPHHAAAFRRWQVSPGGFWAQAWVACTAFRPA
jgi:ubiquinone/menaquinone biosynthesis C-methylase UbiE